MHDGSTTSTGPTPFAVGYGNGYGYESQPTVAPQPVAVTAQPAATVRWSEAAAAEASVPVDPDATVAMAAPVVAAQPAASCTPAAAVAFTARPVGAAHPRRRFARGLVLASLAVVVAGAGIGAVALGSAAEVHPAAATSRSGGPIATSAADVGGQLGHGVDPHGAPTTVPTVEVPASLIESPTLTRVPPTLPPTTAPHPTAPPTTTAPPPTTAPPATTPPTTAPPATTPPTTAAPIGPTFTVLTVPSTVSCPSPGADVPLALAWTAPGATSVTLSIDGPGVYRAYPGASGTETVNFPCGSAHTYLFTAYGSAGTVTTEVVTVSAS